MHSRYLRDLVRRHARTLPLRYISHVDVGESHVHSIVKNPPLLVHQVTYRTPLINGNSAFSGFRLVHAGSERGKTATWPSLVGKASNTKRIELSTYFKCIRSKFFQSIYDVRLLEDADVTVARGKQYLEDLFNRINNTFVRRLVLDFRPSNLPLSHYLRENADDLLCQIGAFRIVIAEDEEEVDGGAVVIDYPLIDFIGAHL